LRSYTGSRPSSGLQPGDVFDTEEDFDEDAFARELLSDDSDLTSLQESAQRSVDRAVRGPVPPESQRVSRASSPSAGTGRSTFAGESLGSFLADLQANNEASVAASQANPFRSSIREFVSDRRGVKENVVAETTARIDERSAFGSMPAGREFVDIANSVYEEGKQQGFNPLGSWRDASRRDLQAGGTAQQEAAHYFDNKTTSANEATNKLKEFAGKFKVSARDLVPGFIANPLALRNPLVEAGGVIERGSQPNPELTDWLSRQTGSPFNKNLQALGGSVSVSSYLRDKDNPRFDIAFKGPLDFKRPKSVRKDLKEVEAELEFLSKQPESKDIQERISRFSENREALKSQLEEFTGNPYTSETVKYQLGRAIEQMPVNSIITASPIGGSGGERDVLYRRMSKGALATQPVFKPNLEQLPTEEEFRAAARGEGLRGSDLWSRINKYADTIRTTKTGPTTFENYNALTQPKPVTWDPSELKDPAIRAAFGIDKSKDVSSLRADPMSVFLNKGRIDFSRPVITTNSPVYKVRQGLKGGIGVGAADLIPSPEAIRSFYSGDVGAGARRMAGDFAAGIPTALAVGGTVAAAPAAAPVAAGVGLGLTGVAAARAANEVVKQQTGEGVVSKVRQFLGTAPRTGVSARDYQPEKAAVTPQIRPLTTRQKLEATRQQDRSELERRVDLARERFNPAKGEFGFSELIFGR
jgi:hypothetical protein